MFLNIKSDDLLKISFFLFPFFLISGSFLPDLLITLIVIIFFIIFIFKKINFSLRNNLLYFFLFFYIYLNLNSLFSFNKIISFQTSLPYLRMILFGAILGHLLSNVKNLKKIILYSILLSYVLLFIDSVVQIYTGSNIFGLPLNYRVSSFFGKWLVMGSFVARTFPIALGITFLEKLKYKKFIQFFIVIISGCLVYFSSERLAFAYYFITLIFFIFFILNKKNAILVLLSIFFFSTLLIFFKPSSFNRLYNHTFSQIKSASSFLSFSYRHELHYITAYNMFKDSKVKGHGLKSFRFLCDDKKYIPLEKIENDNKIFSPFDGYYFFYRDEIGQSHIIVQKKSSPPIENDFINSDKKNFFAEKVYGEFQHYYKNNSEYVKKGEPLISMYEFPDGCNTHPHNVHLQFLAELGLFGYFFLIFGFFYLFMKLFFIIKKFILRNKRLNIECYSFFILLGLFLSIFPFFPSGNFFNNWLSSIFYFNLGFFFHIFNLKKNK
jgi:O-antigen ligase